MKIELYLDELLMDFVDFDPQSLSDIVRETKLHHCFNGIYMFAKNSKSSARYLKMMAECIFVEDMEDSDIQLASLLVLIDALNDPLYNDLLSRASEANDSYCWSKAMATSCLLNNEVNNETVCITA